MGRKLHLNAQLVLKLSDSKFENEGKTETG